jgi:immunoglobulin heavy chain
VEWGKEALVSSQMLSLTCDTYTLSVREYSVSWVRLQPEKGLEWIGVIWAKGSTNYSPNLHSTVIISRDTNKNQVFLQLSNVTAEDSDVYDCAQGTVTSILCEPRQDLPCRGAKNQHSVLRSTKVAQISKEHSEKAGHSQHHIGSPRTSTCIQDQQERTTRNQHGILRKHSPQVSPKKSVKG